LALPVSNTSFERQLNRRQPDFRCKFFR
jgi:hypothetical protein